MSPSRILYVITDLETGGVPLFLHRLATHAQRSGLNVSVCSLAPPGPVSGMLTEAAVPNIGLDATGPWDWRVLERLAGHIGEVRPDLVHALLFHANVSARAACLLNGFPTNRLVCEIQTVEIERPWHLVVEKHTQRWCRTIVGNSPSVIEHLRSAARVDPSRLQLIFGGVDAGPIEAARAVGRTALGIHNDDPTLLWVGRLDPVKGLDELLGAFARVAETCPCNLLLAGDGAYRPRVEQLIDDSPVRRRIFLLGSRSDVPVLLKTADVFVFPSRTEGMPNALLEAMAAGLPCVATDVPGCRDVVTHQVDGLLTQPSDPGDLAASILRLLSDSTLAQRLAAAARAKVRREFSLDRCLSAYLELYDRIL
ncbi:MAG: glycosyltransferase [bacterium]|nr:glycosyltransferase [bacterium]